MVHQGELAKLGEVRIDLRCIVQVIVNPQIRFNATLVGYVLDVESDGLRESTWSVFVLIFVERKEYALAIV